MKDFLPKLAVVLLLHGSGLAGELPPAYRDKFRTAKDFYYRGIYGEKASLEEADKQFRNLHRECPQAPVIAVYFGSLRLLEASHTWALWKKNSLSREGIRLMDSAVDSAPDDLEVRFVRAATERNLPTFFGRKEQSEADFTRIVEHARQAAKQGTFDKRLAAASFFYYGQICKSRSQTRQALDAWNTAKGVDPQSHAAREADGEIAKLRMP